MAETAAETTTVETQNATTETKTPGKIVAAGTPSRLEVVIPTSQPAAENNGADAGDEGGGDEAAKAAAETARLAAEADKNKNTSPESELTNEQLKAYFEKQGIPFESVDKLKETLNKPAPPTNEETEEQKSKAAIEREQRIINEHLSRKGTVEQFTTFKNIISSEKKELGLKKEIEDLVANGIPAEEATELANERYFQLTDEQIEAIEDPATKTKALKQREIGLKKLENKGEYVQKTAKLYLDILEKSLADQDAEKQKVEQHASTVEAAIKNFQRKEKLELGQIAEGQDIAPIDFEYSDTALTSAKELLYDAAKLDQNLFTKDGGVNIDFILPHIVRSFSMPEAIKKAYLVATDRAVEEVKATFSSTPPKLGGTGKPTGTPGKLVSVGERQVFRPTAK